MRRMIVAQALVVFLSTAAAFLAPQTITTKTTTTRVSLLFSSTTANNNNNKNIGLVKTIARPGQGPSVQPGDICTVKYSLYDNNNSNKVPYSKASAQKVVLDGSYIPGFECAIQGMTVGEVATFVLPPTLGYGPFSGVPNLIPSNATLRLEMELLDTNAMSANIDFDEIANADSTPRTAADIAKAYELRQMMTADTVALEGLEAWIAKAKNFYFYGLFEGETGQRPPWFLRPSITFPIAFAIVGAAFYVSFVGGAISERGLQKTDELDEFILSLNYLTTAATAMGLYF